MNINAASYHILKRLRSELPSHLTYHCVDHTLDVVRAALWICREENIDPYQTKLVKTAALYHDAGFIYIYKNHELKSAAIASQTLPQFGYTNEEIHIIKNIIESTEIPQKPKTHLERIICDADLDYLGRSDYFEISETLYKEWKTLDMIKNREDWKNIQLKFLGAHQFHTKTSQQLRTDRLKSIIKKLQNTKG